MKVAHTHVQKFAAPRDSAIDFTAFNTSAYACLSVLVLRTQSKDAFIGRLLFILVMSKHSACLSLGCRPFADRILFRDQPHQNSWLWEHIVDRSKPMQFGYEADRHHPLWDESDYFQNRNSGFPEEQGSRSIQLKTHWLADSSLAPQQLSLDGDWFASQKPKHRGVDRKSLEDEESMDTGSEEGPGVVSPDEDDLPDLDHTLDQAASFGRRLALRTVMSTLKEHQRRFPDRVCSRFCFTVFSVGIGIHSLDVLLDLLNSGPAMSLLTASRGSWLGSSSRMSMRTSDGFWLGSS